MGTKKGGSWYQLPIGEKNSKAFQKEFVERRKNIKRGREKTKRSGGLRL